MIPLTQLLTERLKFDPKTTVHAAPTIAFKNSVVHFIEGARNESLRLAPLMALMVEAVAALEFYASGQHAVSEFNDGGKARDALARLRKALGET